MSPRPLVIALLVIALDVFETLRGAFALVVTGNYQQQLTQPSPGVGDRSRSRTSRTR